MIENSKFCNYVARRLDAVLYEDRGEFVAAYREHNTVHMPLCGVFRMAPMTITPLYGLFLASATATVELAAEAYNVNTVRRTIDELAAGGTGETAAFVGDGGEIYTVTFTYSTAFVGSEQPSPSNTGKIIPVSMTVYLSIIQNGVSSNDVHVTLDGHPVFTTEFSVSNVRVSDAYATDESQARSAVTQAVRSFDFVTPLLKNELGAIIKQSVFGKESARAHALTVSDGEEIYCYIVQFGNEVATVKAPQNVGVNVSLIEAIPEIVTFGEGWIATEADGSTYTVTAPEVPSRMLIFWGDGESDVLDTIKDPSVVEVVHTFKKEDLYTVRIFTEQTVSRRSASVPCEILEVLAESDRTVIVLGQKDKDGFWRYDCVIEWGDGDATHFDTMTANAETACEGASHVYEREGRYTVRICYRDRLWIAKEVTDGE